MDGNGVDHEAEHLHDLVQRSEPSPPVDEKPVRHLYVWAILFVLYGLLLLQALAGSFSNENEEGSKNLQREVMIKQIARTKTLMQVAGQSGMLGSLSALDESTGDLFRAPYKSVDAARYGAVVAFEQGKPVPPEALVKLKESSKPEDADLIRLYGTKKLDEKQYLALTQDLPQKPFVYRLARVHAYEKSGDTGMRKAMISVVPLLVYFAAIIGGLGAALLGVALWIVYLAKRQSGDLQPLGNPSEPVDLNKADILALRAIQLLVLHLAIQMVLGTVFGGGKYLGVYLVSSAVAMLVLSLMLFRIPIHGRQLTLADVGLNSRNLGRNVMWGIAGFCANLPVFFLTAGLISLLSKYLPQPYHPISDVAMRSSQPLVVLGILLQGVILAPFWEELMFRGCLFPSLSRLTKSVMWGGFLAAFMFVSIHPQGIAAWMALFTVAGMSTFLVHQTRSLVPSLVLHAVHNGTLLTLSLLMR